MPNSNRKRRTKRKVKRRRAPLTLAERREELIRNFKENGIKFLLENPRNTAELLTYVAAWVVDWIDPGQLTPDPTTMIKGDYRKIEADLLFRVPRRRKLGGRLDAELMLYILLEHQSEPDPLMILRLLEYVVQAYKRQVRRWKREHGSLRGIRLQPVLAIVFYTGHRTWTELQRISALIDFGEAFRDYLPSIRPNFINLDELDAAVLRGADCRLGWILRVFQERHASRERLEAVVHEAIEHFKKHGGDDHEQWSELLSYLAALIYHERSWPDRTELTHKVAESVPEPFRKEFHSMAETAAQYLDRRGAQRGRKEGREQANLAAAKRYLLRTLQTRFGDIPKDVQQVIQQSKDAELLDHWDEVARTAKTLDKVGIR